MQAGKKTEKKDAGEIDDTVAVVGARRPGMSFARSRTATRVNTFMLDFDDIKTLSLGGLDVNTLYADGRLLWRATVTLTYDAASEKQKPVTVAYQTVPEERQRAVVTYSTSGDARSAVDVVYDSNEQSKEQTNV